MENTRLDSAPIEEIEQELQSIYSSDFPRGFDPEKQYLAAQLLGRMNKEFEESAGKMKVLGYSTFKEWMKKFREKRQGVSERYIFYYVKIGRYVLPQISEEQFDALGFVKAEILSAVAKAGRLTQDLVQASYGYSKQELEQIAAPLLGKKVSWVEPSRINSHEAAQAVLLQLGSRLDFETYTAHPGEKFNGQELGEIATLHELPRFATEQIMKSVNRIDVVWLKDDYPEYFFEVENTTDVTSGLHRMFQAVKYGENFFIVGPKEVKSRYLREIEKAPFKAVKQKYLFRSYDELIKMFRVAMKFSDAHAEFFERQE
jgi:hypothetical protein